MEPIFVDGVPARVTVADFRRYHLQSFPSLREPESDDLIQNAIDTVYTMFPGASTAWDLHDRQMWFEKTQLAYRLLAAWLIADQYPDLMSGVISIAGIKKKKVDGVDIMFDPGIFSGDSPLMWLKSNDFGRKVLMMSGTMPKRALLRVEKFV